MRLRSIFGNINDQEVEKQRYFAEHLVKSISLMEGIETDGYELNVVVDKLISTSFDYNTLEEANEFLDGIEGRIDEGFMDTIGKVGSAIKSGAKKVINKVKEVVSNLWTGPVVAAIKKWNQQVVTIIDKYEGVTESQKVFEDAYLIEKDMPKPGEETEETPAPETKEEVKPEPEVKEEPKAEETPTPAEEPIKDNLTFWKQLINKSGVKDDDDGFYTSAGIDPEKVWANFLMFAKKSAQYDFLTVLRISDHKLNTFKPMKDKDVMAYFANMTLLLTTIKDKKLVPPDEDPVKFRTELLKPLIKYSSIMNQTVGRNTLDFSSTPTEPQKNPNDASLPKKEGTKTDPLQPKELDDAQKSAIAQLTQQEPTLVKKIDSIANEETKGKIAQAVIGGELDPKFTTDMISNNNFLENNINTDEKIKYIKELKAGGFKDAEIFEIAKFIIDNDMEDTFHTTPIKDLKKVRTALASPGRLKSLLEEIFNRTKL